MNVILICFSFFYSDVWVKFGYFLKFDDAILAYTFIEYLASVFSREDNVIFCVIKAVTLLPILHDLIIVREDGGVYPSPAVRLGLAGGGVNIS